MYFVSFYYVPFGLQVFDVVFCVLNSVILLAGCERLPGRAF